MIVPPLAWNVCRQKEQRDVLLLATSVGLTLAGKL
jgi:hypothetical protein